MIDLRRDYFDYRDACEAAGEHPLDFNPWLVARINALEDMLQGVLVLLKQQDGDGK